MKKIVAVAARKSFITTLMEDNTIGEWDTTEYSTDKWTKTEYGSLEGISQLAKGVEHSLALTNDGKVFGWGSGKFGQLGLMHKLAKTPIQVKGLPPIKSISVACYQNIALDFEGKVWRWGLERNEEIPSSNAFAIWYTMPSRASKKMPKIKEIVSSRNIHLMLDTNNQLWTMGTKVGTLLSPKASKPIKLEGASNAQWLTEGDSIVQISKGNEANPPFLIKTKKYGWLKVSEDFGASIQLSSTAEKMIYFENRTKSSAVGKEMNPDVVRAFTDTRSGALPYSDVFETLIRHLTVQEFTL